MGLLDKPSKQLNPAIWDENNKLLSHVKIEILSKLNTLIPRNLIKSVWFIGSNASLQYNAFSDIDLNVTTTILPGRAHSDELAEWHHIFKFHNKQMDFLTGTTHPINYFVQPNTVINWGEETTSVYLIKNFDTGKEDVWSRPFIPFEKIRNPEDRFALNTPYAKLYGKVVRSKLSELSKDLSDLSTLEGKSLVAKLKEVEEDA